MMNNEEKILEMLVKQGEMLVKQGEMLTEMRSDIAELKDTQAKQGEQLAKQGEQIRRIEERLEAVDERSLRNGVLLENDVAAKVQLVLEGHDSLARQMDTLATKKQVDELADDVGIIKSVVTQHSREIHELQRAQ